MGQPKDFKYYIRRRITPTSYVYYFINSLGTVTTTGTKEPIIYAPDGWMEKSIKFSRDFEKSGVFKSYTVPMRFVNDGGKIIKSIFFNEGVDSPVEFYIEKIDRATQVYSAYFVGDIDLTTFNYESEYVTVSIKNNDYLNKLESKYDTDYEIDVDTNPDFFYIYMDGIDLKCTFPFITVREPINSSMITAPKSINSLTRLEPTLISLPFEGYANGDIQAQDVKVNFSILQFFVPPNYPSVPFEISIPHTVDWLIRNISTTNSYDIDIELDFDVTWSVDAASPSSCYIQVEFITAQAVSGLAASIHQINTLYTSSVVTPSNSTTSNVTASSTITVPPNHGLWMVVRYRSLTSGGFGKINMEDGGDVIIRYNNKVPESYVKALRPKKVFENLVDSISEGTVTAESTILEDNENIAVTSGDALRGLDDSKIKTSFKDFFKSFDVILSLGTHYDIATKEHYINEKSDYYQNVSMGHLGSVANLDIKFLSDELHANLHTGYRDFTYDELNGRDEFNTTFEWTLPTDKKESILDLICLYRADMFGIEFTRANLVNKNTTDSNSDNDTFLIRIEDTPAGTYNGVNFYNIYRDGSLTIDNLLSPSTAFNIQLSPKRNLLNYGSYIRSMYYLSGSKYIKFQVAKKNQLMETDDGVTIIDEDADVLISTLDAPIFYPIIFEFDFIPNSNAIDLINSDPYGYLTFDWKGNTYQGFLIDIEEEPATNKSTRAKLLSTTNNTLTNLI